MPMTTTTLLVHYMIFHRSIIGMSVMSMAMHPHPLNSTICLQLSAVLENALLKSAFFFQKGMETQRN